jgi:hypothetical protein
MAIGARDPGPPGVMGPRWDTTAGATPSPGPRSTPAGPTIQPATASRRLLHNL